MPTYQYVCESCGEDFERVQSFSDPSLTAHEPGCGGPVHKRYNAVGVVFKGSGFYRTDSRSAPSEAGSGETTSDTKSETKTDSAAKTDSKPAETTTSKPKEPAASTPAKASTPAA